MSGTLKKKEPKRMHLSYAQLAKRPAILHRLVGLNVAEFEQLLEEFAVQYHQQVIQPRVSAPDRRRALGGGQKGALPTVADKLLFILVYTRMYPLLIVQGMFFGLVESKAWTWVGILLPVLDAALEQIHVRPKERRDDRWRTSWRSFPNSRNWECSSTEPSGPSAAPKMPQSRKRTILGRKSAIRGSMSPSCIPRR